jgi:hypothetical protein
MKGVLDHEKLLCGVTTITEIEWMIEINHVVNHHLIDKRLAEPRETPKFEKLFIFI